MASNDIILIPNQPIQFYKQNPTDAELALGMTAWAQTAYHKRLGVCGFIGPNYCHPVLDTDFMTFQFKAKTTGANVVPQLSASILSSGANTSVSPDQLINSGENFITDGVVVSNVVVNSTDNTGSFVNNVASATTLDLDHDIFLATPKSYKVISWKGNGEWKYNINTDTIHMDAPSPTTLYKEGVLVVGTYYKVTINVTDLTAGNFQIKLGTNSIATINSVGTHVIYGQCLTNTDFILQASSAFVGSITDDIEVLEVQTAYTISIFDLDDNFVNAITYDASGDASLSIGNVFINIEWGNFALECGKYVVGIGEGSACTGQMIQNGNFAEGETGWTIIGDGEVGEGKMVGNDFKEGEGFYQTLQCCMTAEHSYTLTWDVGPNLDTLQSGGYGVYIGSGIDVLVSPNYNIGAQSGTITLTFTAPVDSCFIGFFGTTEDLFGSWDNISLIDNTPVLFSEVDSLSECICVCDEHECTILMKYKNENNAFGLYYDANSPYNYFRLEATLLNSPIKDNELIQFKNTLHFMNIPYWDGMKIFKLATDLLPAWVHDTISAVLKHRELLIDGVRYIGIEEHSYSEEQTEVFGGETKIALWNQQYLNNAY